MAETPQQPALASTGNLPAWLLRVASYRTLMVPIGFVALLAVILVPLPPVGARPADQLQHLARGASMLLTTLNMTKPLEFSVFPSLLLATTLLQPGAQHRLDPADPDRRRRRRPARHGRRGQGHPGVRLVRRGGSLFVGVIIFLILMVVQFMVVTKGAGRISEVAARFTLDAMPGKQMAIDSDLNAGLIDEAEAKATPRGHRPRGGLLRGDGRCQKFVKGDAIAGIIITAINVIGGFAVGMIEKGWPAGETAESFTKLTIGDGLTSQIPSFVISIASALIVTQSGAKDDFGQELTGQLSSKPRGLIITGGFLALLAVTPLPTAPLLVTAGALVAIGWGLAPRREASPGRGRSRPSRSRSQAEPPPVEDLLKVDLLELEVGYGLVPLVDTTRGGDLLDRISAVRRQLAVEMGVVVPPVRIRDNMQLEPTAYRVKIRGNAVVAKGGPSPAGCSRWTRGSRAGRCRARRRPSPRSGWTRGGSTPR
jgi:flagellar biosynthesis protein FlhA